MITIRDVAKKAGVSVSTASRALNNNARISAATKVKIKKIADELGYLPNYNAKNLTLGKANVVGVIFPPAAEDSQDNPFYIDMLRGINDELLLHNFVLSVAMGATDKKLLQNVKSMVQQAKIKSFVVLYTDRNDLVTKYLRQQQLNFVVIGQPESGSADRFVDNNNVAAGQAATDYLIQNFAVKDPLFVQSEYGWQYEVNRRQGYETSMRQNGFTPIIFELPKVNLSQSLARFLAANQQIDAVISTDDLGFISFYRAWQTIRPQNEVPAICFNRSSLINLLGRKIATVDMLPKKLGSGAAELLFEQQSQKIIEYKIN